MDKLKKLNGSMIAAIVLSVLLIMSVTAGATLAWFASRDSASNSLTMGEAVVVTIGEDYKQGHNDLAMNIPVTTGGLLPAMSVTPNIKVQLQKSNTNALVRARFITTAEYPDNYVDAAYADTTKYPGIAGSDVSTYSGRVLSETDFPSNHVYAGSITYNYYDSVGNLDTTKSKTRRLARVEVRQALVDALNKTEKYPEGEWEINGIKVVVTAANIAELEIRQRGVDLTSAINRVLAGQRGYGIDPTSGEPMLNENVGVKYSRRVADGWAYREADQAWYYLGSQTNGFVTANQTGVSEAVTTTQAAKDIAWYSSEQAGNVTMQKPHYTTLGYTANPYKTTKTAQGADKTRNYLGGTENDNTMDIVANEIAVLNQPTMASVDLSAGNVSIDFLTKRFILPTFINNNYARAELTFTFTVEAVQDYLVDPLQEGTSAADRLPNNLVNAILVFNNAFPQAISNKTGNEALQATGVATNVVPGGGIPSSVVWNSETGTTTLEYNGNKEQGKLNSYGFLDDATINGTPYIYDDPSTIKVETEGDGLKSATSTIKGFGTKTDDYGVIVADYTVSTTYVRGTASSLGIAPFIEAQRGTAGTDETWPATGGGSGGTESGGGTGDDDSGETT